MNSHNILQKYLNIFYPSFLKKLNSIYITYARENWEKNFYQSSRTITKYLQFSKWNQDAHLEEIK